MSPTHIHFLKIKIQSSNSAYIFLIGELIHLVFFSCWVKHAAYPLCDFLPVKKREGYIL